MVDAVVNFNLSSVRISFFKAKIWRDIRLHLLSELSYGHINIGFSRIC